MTFCGDKGLTKVVHTMIAGILNILTPNLCQDDFVDRGHLDREYDILGRQVGSLIFFQFKIRQSRREGSGKVQGRFRKGSGKIQGRFMEGSGKVH